MSWMNALYDTYENLDMTRNRDPYIAEHLLKMGQSTQNCHIEIMIDECGNFISASHLAKDNAETLIPVTESSASRSSGSSPHPLFDKLKYLAGDYREYSGDDNKQYHEEYMNQLEQWVVSEYSTAKVKAVYSYLKKGNIISDLIEYGIFSVGSDGKLTKKWETSSATMAVGDQADAMIRFRVTGIDDVSATWEDEEIQDNFAKFYMQSKTEQGLCYIKGEILPKCVSHPSKIRNTGDKAKIISSNDMSNFTYRGRFDDAGQAFDMSYEASQKCHNALKFLIRKQGVKVGDRVYVLWGVKGEDVPNIEGSTINFISQDEDDDLSLTDENIAKKFNAAILGYKAQLDNQSRLALIGLDAATTGRLSVVFCREYMGQRGHELIDNIKRWHSTCPWNTFYWSKDNKKVYYTGIPSLRTIANSAFGIEQGSFVKCDARLQADTVERLLLCISDGSKIPRDIVRAAISKALCPQNYNNYSNWLQVLSVACTMYGKYLADYEGKEVTMSDANETKREVAYKCGQLLAVADAIERWALSKKAETYSDIRTTNAMRLFSRYAQKPCETWGVICKKLAPYKEQLGSEGNQLYNLIGEISDSIGMKEFDEVRNLGGTFCLGFDSQRIKIINEAKEKALAKKEEDK